MRNVLIACALFSALTSTAAAEPVVSSRNGPQTSGQETPRRLKPAAKQAKGKRQSQQPVRKPQPATPSVQGTRTPANGQGGALKVTPDGRPDSIGDSLAALERKAGLGQATAADIQRVGQQISALPSSPSDQRAAIRLQRTVNDLGQRARSSPLTAQDVAVLHEQWIDTRLDRALNGLASRAGQQRLTRDDFAQLSNLLKKRAAAGSSLDPKAGGARKQLQAEITRLQQRSDTHHLISTDFDQLRAGLHSARLQRALSDLERRSLSKNASPEDVARVNDRIDDQASGAHVDPKLAQKLRRAISSLEGRALRGEVTRAEFSELRASLTKRARNAARKK